MPKIRNIIIFTAIVAILAMIYVFLVRPPEDEGSALVTTSPVETDVTSLPNVEDSTVANDFLNLLLSVKSIKLEDSIFSDEAFNSLRDSSITLIPDGTEGRPNPFAPIGRDIALPGTEPVETDAPSDSTTNTIQFPSSGASSGAQSETNTSTPAPVN